MPLRIFSTKWPRSTQVFFETLKNMYVYDSQKGKKKKKRCTGHQVQNLITMELFSGCFKIAKFQVQ